MGSTINWIALYAAVVSTIVFVWEAGKWLSGRRELKRERSNIRIYPGIRIVKRNVPHFGDMHIFPLCISNLGREPVIIQSVEMRWENCAFHPGAYNEPEAALGVPSKRMLPKKLDPGETIELEQFTLAAYRSKPAEIVAVDGEGREHRMPRALMDREFQQAQKLLKAQA
jgi:hypothetical protein